MDLFPDGGFVRLQNRETSKYVYAAGNWLTVSMRSSGAVPSLDEVWRVQHWLSPSGNTFVLLQNAAYGRYLSYDGANEAPSGHRGYLIRQLDRDEPINAMPVNQNNCSWAWTVERLEAPDQGFVSLRFTAGLRYTGAYLRANGKYLRWNNLVTAEPDREASSKMMHWIVHGVASSRAPVPRPLPPPVTLAGGDPDMRPSRRIRHVRANDEGEFDQNEQNWPAFLIYEDSVDRLRNQLSHLQDDRSPDVSYTLCVRPGSHGRLMPLVTYLPHTPEPMDIVVFKTGSPGAAALMYPTLPLPPNSVQITIRQDDAQA